MKNYTTLEFIEKWEYDNSLKFKDAISEDVIYAKSFNGGNLKLDISCGNTIHNASDFVVRMFNEKSNTDSIINRAFDNRPEIPVSIISFDFNGAVITATKETTVEEMVKQLYDHYDEDEKRSKAEYEEYKKTPQYEIDMEIQRKKDAARIALTKEIKNIDETTVLEFKDEEAEKNWNTFVEINSKDGYSRGVVDYARLWAKYMQFKISKGEKLIDIASPTSHDTDIDGITGFMYGCAVNILSQVWKYGEELRMWHNKQYNHDGDGCVNPAVLTINV